MPHRHRKHPQHPKLSLLQGDFVRVAGEPIRYAAETDRIESNIDHFWITILLPAIGELRISLSTWSRQNAQAGFDGRVRVAVLTNTWENLPAPALVKCAGLDYREIEATSPVIFVEYDRPALEALLTLKTRNAILIEAWGELYLRNHLGLHQVHSRRASCSVLQDFAGRDGAIRFYLRDGCTSEMLLFKYCGQ